MTTARDIVIYQGQAFALSLPYAGTAGRGQRMHIRSATNAATVIQILTHNGDANARVLFDGTDAIDVTIGASFSALWLVGADRVEWVYDIEDYALADDDDVIITHRGKCIVYGNRTRESDVTPSEQMPSGDGRYVRFDSAQGLSAPQQLQARENIGVTLAGSGDVVGPASVTEDRIAAFDGDTGKLIKQGTVTATAVASHIGSTSNPHSVTAVQVGADPAGTAYGAVSTHNSVTTAHGISAFGATLVDDADASAARTTLGLGTAATGASADFAAASHAHAASAITSGTLTHERGGLEADVSAYAGLVKITGGATSAVTVTAAGEALLDDATDGDQRTTLGLGGAAVLNVGTTAGTVAAGDDSRFTNAATTSAAGHVELAIASEVDTGTDDTRAMTPDSYRDSTPYYTDRAADWTLAQADANTEQQFNSGSARVCTIDTNANQAISTGTVVPFLRLGSGSATIDAVAGVTLNGVDGASKVISTQYQGALLRKTGTNAWVLSGDIA